MKKAFLFILLAAAIFLVSYKLISSYNLLTFSGARERIDGFNLVAPRDKFPIDSLMAIKNIGAEWVAIVPYAFCDPADGNIIFGDNRQWWGETPEGVKATIEMAHEAGLKVMLKPHLWIRGQGWAGDLDFPTNEAWKHWEAEYAHYLKTYIKIAEDYGVELFCMGTEIRQSTRKRVDFWQQQIKYIRAHYSGLITYAANWDEFEYITFWNQLDFIGIDAYFPLSEAKTPNLSDLASAWTAPSAKMESMSKRYGRQVIFTEYGYESVDYPAIGHWNVNKDTLAINLIAQDQSYKALYEQFNEADWWSGGFAWKWHLTRLDKNKRMQKAYTPQLKPSLKTIEYYFNQK